MTEHQNEPASAAAMPSGSDAVGLGVAAGVLLGYPISYYFQPGALRAKMSLGKYVQNIGDVMGSDELRSTAIVIWIGCIVVFPILAQFLAGRSSSR